MSGGAAGTIAVTGASGLVGSALCKAFAARGWAVRALSRRQSAGAWFKFELPEGIDLAAVEGCDAVIHAAYAFGPGHGAEARRINEEGTRRLRELCRRASARFVFISSFSAHEEARSQYGQSKLAIERSLDPACDLAIRPGLVLSASGGVFGAMADQIRKRRVIPLVGGGSQPLQTIHIDDLCEGVVAAVERKLVGRVLLAEASPITMRRFLGLLAGRLNRKPVFIPVPAWAVLAGARVLETCGLKPPITSENVRGLIALRAADTREDLARLGLSPRSAEQSLRELPL